MVRVTGPSDGPGSLPHGWATEPFVLAEHATSTVHGAWATPTALFSVVARPGGPLIGLGLGPRAAVADLVRRAWQDDAALVRSAGILTLPRGTFDVTDGDVLAPLDLGGARVSGWDWMWTDRLLGTDPGRAQRLSSTRDVAGEIAGCLARAHPSAGTAPDDERAVGWWGVRHEGALVAVVGAVRFAPGLAPRLVSLGVDPSYRGQGLAGMLLAAAVTDCLALVPDVGPPMVTLGLYADNDVARRVYRRHGFRLGHELSSARR